MINIAKLLKNCPIGTKLYSPLFGEVKLDDAGGMIYVTTKYGSSKCFTETGCYYVDNETFSTECLLFPSKDCRTWEGWKLPVEPKFNVGDWIVRGEGFVYEPSLITEIRDYYICELLNGERVTYTLNDVHKNFHLWTLADAKDGDVLAAHECYVIFKEIDGLNIKCYCTYHYMGFNPSFHIDTLQNKTAFNPATREQRDMFFAKIREEGYEWDEKKKELHKIKPHYDISNFKPKQWVLVRQGEGCAWRLDVFSHLKEGTVCQFECVGNSMAKCIPFNDDTKHLLGTTDMCDECYINW